MYECIKELYIDKYDEDGFYIEGKYIHVPVGSRWEVKESELIFSILDNEDNIHLDRVWKTKNAKTWQWIEISKDRLEEHFKKVID